MYRYWAAAVEEAEQRCSHRFRPRSQRFLHTSASTTCICLPSSLSTAEAAALAPTEWTGRMEPSPAAPTLRCSAASTSASTAAPLRALRTRLLSSLWCWRMLLLVLVHLLAQHRVGSRVEGRGLRTVGRHRSGRLRRGGCRVDPQAVQQQREHEAGEQPPRGLGGQEGGSGRSARPPRLRPRLPRPFVVEGEGLRRPLSSARARVEGQGRWQGRGGGGRPQRGGGARQLQEGQAPWEGVRRLEGGDGER